MAGTLQMRRSRGAFSGFVLMLLGLWGALIPFIGPYFHYAYTPDTGWTYNTGRLWLELLPGAAVFLGGFLLMIARGRHIAMFGALLASPAGATVYMRIMEQLGFFTALGVVIVFVAAAALGRIASVASGIRDIEEIPEAPETTVPADTVPTATVPADTMPVERVPAHAGSRPARTRMEPVVPARPVKAEETRAVPAQDTKGTVGSGTV